MMLQKRIRKTNDGSRRGSVLIGVLVALVVLSILAIGLIAVTASGLKVAVFDRDFNAVYYIAESGINRTVGLIQDKAVQLANLDLEHEEYFSMLSEFVSNEVNGSIISDFTPVSGVVPEASVGVEQLGISGSTEVDNFTEVTYRYAISSTGEISGRTRKLTSEIDISHRVYEGGGGIEPAFEHSIYYGGTSTMIITHAAKITGSVYGYNVITRSSSTDISGDIISLTDVVIAHGTVVRGDVYAYGMYESGGDVELQPSTALVMGNIHASGDVSLGSGCITRGSVYSGGNITLDSSSSVIYSNAYADGNILMGWKTRIDGISYAGGSINEDTPANTGQPYPPLIAPDLSAEMPIPEPSLTEFDIGTTDIIFDRNHADSVPRVIQPGSYKDLSIGGSYIVRFSSGNYYFNSVTGSPNIILQLDFTNGPINIYVKNDLTFGSELSVKVSDDGVTFIDMNTLYAADPNKALTLAGKMYTEVQRNFTLQSSNPDWFGTVLVGGNVDLGYGFTIIGGVSVIDGIIKNGTSQEYIYAPPVESAAGAGTEDPDGDTGDDGSKVSVVISKPIRED